MKAYLANGLFSRADFLFNEYLLEGIRWDIPELKVYAPQENEAINDKSEYADSLAIAEADSKELMSSDLLIAVIDGVEIDSGVSAEIGMFATTGKPIFALYTDSRQQGNGHIMKLLALQEDATENQFMYRNLFVIGLIKKSGGGVYADEMSLIKAVGDYVEETEND